MKWSAHKLAMARPPDQHARQARQWPCSIGRGSNCCAAGLDAATERCALECGEDGTLSHPLSLLHGCLRQPPVGEMQLGPRQTERERERQGEREGGERC